MILSFDATIALLTRVLAESNKTDNAVERAHKRALVQTGLNELNTVINDRGYSRQCEVDAIDALQADLDAAEWANTMVLL